MPKVVTSFPCPKDGCSGGSCVLDTRRRGDIIVRVRECLDNPAHRFPTVETAADSEMVTAAGHYTTLVVVDMPLLESAIVAGMDWTGKNLPDILRGAGLDVNTVHNWRYRHKSGRNIRTQRVLLETLAVALGVEVSDLTGPTS